jgi:subtilisin-like proprotein convertase family protein
VSARLALLAAFVGFACGGDEPGPSERRLAADDPCAAHAGSTDAVAIPDLDDVEAAITLPPVGGDIVRRVSVTVEVRHPYPRDLELTLISPGGTEVLLVGDTGLGRDFIDTTFRDDAALSIEEGAGPFSGSFRPAQPLAAFIGEGPASGEWRLRVVDAARGDAGSLVAWNLRVDVCETAPCAGATVTTPLQYPATPEPAIRGEVTGQGDATVEEARVTVWARHPFASQLDLRLYAPSGRRVELSTDNGGSGNNYWATAFDDDAMRSIVEGEAPFTGRFRPEEPLSRMRGERAEGTWSVTIVDDVADGYQGAASLGGLHLQLCEVRCPAGTFPLYAAADAASGQIAGVPDLGSVLAPIEVAVTGGAKVAHAAARATIIHPDVSQLVLTLRSPAGATATLAERAGAPGDPFFRRLFEDEALQDALDGEPAFGVWELEVQDVVAGDAGRLISAEVFLCVE